MMKNIRNRNKLENDQQDDAGNDWQDEALRQADMRLSAILFRSQCPEPEALLNYQWDLLREEQSVSIAAHLAECPHCLKEAIQLAPPEQGSLSPTSSIDDFRQWLRLFIGRLAPPNAVPAAIRSATSPKSTPGLSGQGSDTNVYAVSELGWDIILSQWPESDATCALQGQLLGATTKELTAFKVSLIQKGYTVITTKLNQTGTFEFPAVPIGEYTLCFHTPQVKACIPHVPLK